MTNEDETTYDRILDFLHSCGLEHVKCFWSIKGPKMTQIDKMHAFLFRGRVLIFQTYRHGGWDCYAPVSDSIEIDKTREALLRRFSETSAETVVTEIETLLREALAYKAEAFDNDLPVSGTDLVDWFSEWRSRARAALPRSPYATMLEALRDVHALLMTTDDIEAVRGPLERVRAAIHAAGGKDPAPSPAIAVSALGKIASCWPDDAPPPEAESYDDTESAYNNGIDVATYECASIARKALKEIGG